MREAQLAFITFMLCVIVWQLGDIKAHQVHTSQQIEKIAETLASMNGVKP